MIELDKKENAPSQQDVDSYVHSLYAYADNLISEGCYSCNYDKIRSDLSYFKIDESSITSIINDIRGYFKEAQNRAATKELAYGAFWMALGFFLTHIN